MRSNIGPSLPAPGRAAGYLDSARVDAGVIRRVALLAGSQLSGWRHRRAQDRASRLRRAGPPDLREWHARCLTRASRGTPQPAQAPSLVAREEPVKLRPVHKMRIARASPLLASAQFLVARAERAALQPVYRARRVDRAVGCLAERGAVRRASHSGSCGGPRGTPAGRHDRRNRESSLRKLMARRDLPRPSVARRASRGVEAPHSAVDAQGTQV